MTIPRNLSNLAPGASTGGAKRTRTPNSLGEPGPRTRLRVQDPEPGAPTSELGPGPGHGSGSVPTDDYGDEAECVDTHTERHAPVAPGHGSMPTDDYGDEDTDLGVSAPAPAPAPVPVPVPAPAPSHMTTGGQTTGGLAWDGPRRVSIGGTRITLNAGTPVQPAEALASHPEVVRAARSAGSGPGFGFGPGARGQPSKADPRLPLPPASAEAQDF